METVLLVAVLIVVLLAFSLQLLSRRNSTSPSSPQGQSGETANSEDGLSDASSALVLAEDEVLVLPPAPGDESAIVLGPEESLAALERSGLLTPRKARRPFQQLVDRIAVERRKGEQRRLVSAAREPVEGGYLKLSEESRRQLAEGTPVVTSTGEMLGMVNDARGRRRKLLRFTDYKVAADPNLVMAAANLRAMAALQDQLEAVEERLIEVQKTLDTLCKELDRERLGEITGAMEMLQEVAANIRRRGRMTSSDWAQVVETRLAIKRQLASARFNITDLTRDFDPQRSRHQRLELLEDVLKGNRLDFWLTMFVEAVLAHIRSDVLTLLHEATEYPDELGDLAQRTRAQIDARHQELAAVGTLLRDLSDPEARRWIDHFQQISKFQLKRQRPVVEGLLDAHGDVFAEHVALTEGRAS